ncbi:hypothetical protein U9M48_039345 [Paspalum notatum var. saurae]|uniref:DUF4218 domain-containing protein n=1 Tax=Paspalum notatum var. saurae TaxID=547442 RepID=A0AAQ3XBY8_PASNO
MLQPFIKELKQLWYGVEAYDISLKQKFTLRAAYLWSVHDFMAYGIFAGWSVHGTLTCPICGVDTRCFHLEFGGKIYYFDCHRCWLPSDHIFRGEKDSFRKDTVCYEGPPKMLSAQKILDQLASLKLNEEKTTYEGLGKEHNWTHISGIWDLPYAKALKLPHNIDVMHQERNVAESIISTCMDFSDKTKDNVKARKDLAKICKWPTLELTASGVGLKRAVNLKTGKLNGLKAHDYHIIMERLVPMMFRGYLPNGVWSVLAELSYFYRQLCTIEIKKEMMEKLEKDVPVLICKMEKNFPPGFFNPMQHLLVHLAYEAKVGGPVQFRWMFHIERALKYLRAMVGNKARVEGCIAEAFILKEISYFSSVYFAEEHNVNAPTMRYNVDEEPSASDLPIFQSTRASASASSPYYFKPENEFMKLITKRLAEYGKEMERLHGEGFDWRTAPVDPQAVYESGGGKSHGWHSMFNGMIDSRQVQRRSSSQSSGGSSSRLRRTTSKMEIDNLKQEIQKRDAFLKAQEEYQKEQQAHAQRFHAQQMAAIQAMYQAQGMTFVIPEVAPALVPPQWGMFAQMSFSPAPQGSGVQESNPYQTPPPASGQHGDQQSGQQSLRLWR